jgi:hypothetical protein
MLTILPSIIPDGEQLGASAILSSVHRVLGRLGMGYTIDSLVEENGFELLVPD